MNLIKKVNEKKNIFIKKENIFFLFFIILIFSIDRLTKDKIANSPDQNVYFLNEFINFDLIWNIGIGFGLLSSSSYLFYNLVSTLIGLVILILIYIFLTANKSEKFIYSLIIGGALGNFYDRLVYKAVPDFIDLHYENFHWFTFNLADIFITLGIITFIAKDFFVKSK